MDPWSTDYDDLRAAVENNLAQARCLQHRSAELQKNITSNRAELKELSAQTAELSARAHERRAAHQPGPVDQLSSAAGDAVPLALAAVGRDESDLCEIADDMIASYRAAEAGGDEEAQALLARALMQIGRHLATKVGPKAAGVTMN